MAYTNAEMDAMISCMEPLLERTDCIGFAAAKNTRLLQNELVEYRQKKNELIMELGEKDLDAEGRENGNMSIKPGTPAMSEFSRRIDEFAKQKAEPKLMKLSAEDVIGKLSGSDVLRLEWMIDLD